MKPLPAPGHRRALFGVIFNNTLSFTLLSVFLLASVVMTPSTSEAYEVRTLDVKIYGQTPNWANHWWIDATPQLQTLINQVAGEQTWDESTKTWLAPGTGYSPGGPNRRDGGIVIVPRGVYFVRPLELYDNTELHLEEGAILAFPYNVDDYLRNGRWDWNTACIRALNRRNVKITGPGMIFGHSVVIPEARVDEQTIYNGALSGKFVGLFEEGAEVAGFSNNLRGVHGIRFDNCRDIEIGGDFSDNNNPRAGRLQVEQFGNYSMFMLGCTDVKIHDVYTYGGWDGIHGREVYNCDVQNIYIDHNCDDAIAGHDNVNWTIRNIRVNGGFPPEFYVDEDLWVRQKGKNLKFSQGSGIRFGCFDWSATDIHIMNKDLPAFLHFSPVDYASKRLRTTDRDPRFNDLSGDNGVISDVYVKNCSAVFEYEFGGPTQGDRPMGSTTMYNVRAEGIRSAAIKIKGSTFAAEDPWPYFPKGIRVAGTSGPIFFLEDFRADHSNDADEPANARSESYTVDPAAQSGWGAELQNVGLVIMNSNPGTDVVFTRASYSNAYILPPVSEVDVPASDLIYGYDHQGPKLYNIRYGFTETPDSQMSNYYGQPTWDINF